MREFPTTLEGLSQADRWIAGNVKEFLWGRYDYNIESTGIYHWPVIRALRGVAHVVNPLLANPTRRKTDVLDAKLLARQALPGMWNASFVPSDAAVEVRTVLMRRHDALWRAN